MVMLASTVPDEWDVASSFLGKHSGKSLCGSVCLVQCQPFCTGCVWPIFQRFLWVTMEGRAVRVLRGDYCWIIPIPPSFFLLMDESSNLGILIGICYGVL